MQFTPLGHNRYSEHTRRTLQVGTKQGSLLLVRECYAERRWSTGLLMRTLLLYRAGHIKASSSLSTQNDHSPRKPLSRCTSVCCIARKRYLFWRCVHLRWVENLRSRSGGHTDSSAKETSRANLIKTDDTLWQTSMSGKDTRFMRSLWCTEHNDDALQRIIIGSKYTEIWASLRFHKIEIWLREWTSLTLTRAHTNFQPDVWRFPFSQLNDVPLARYRRAASRYFINDVPLFYMMCR